MTDRRRITVIDGHPDPDDGRYIHALATSYAEGAAAGGHEVRRVGVADEDFPLLRTRHDWEGGEALPPDIRAAQEAILWADHLLILFPLWLGDMPALLKGFLEQVMRPGFAFAPGKGRMPERKLTGRSARVVVTMGMPALFYRAYYRAHSVKSLERNILKFTGISPVEQVLIGNVEGDAGAREDWLRKLYALGVAGA